MANIQVLDIKRAAILSHIILCGLLKLRLKQSSVLLLKSKNLTLHLMGWENCILWVQLII
jgi:hypothetical protein